MWCKRGATAIILGLIVSASSCSNNKDAGYADTEESINLRLDSLNSMAGACEGSFFQGLKRFEDSNSAHLVIDSGQRVTLTQYFRDEFMSTYSAYGIKDLDSDGVSELVIYNNTGGAHCCDEFTVFTMSGTNEYRFMTRIMGAVCISSQTNRFTYSFNESLGYFFSCYACTFEDSVQQFETIRGIQLAYKAGTLVVIPYSKKDEAQNLRNLEILKNHGYEKLVGMMDNGWRKEYAINLAVWHFNHGKDWTTTKTLFDQYYPFPDHKRVWNELYSTIIATSRENNF